MNRTAGDVARALGTTPPRVIRASDVLFGAAVKTSGGHRRFSEGHVRVLTAWLGKTPIARAGFTREDYFILAALLWHARGLRSARQVALSAGVSPATATRRLAHLESRGLVKKAEEHVVEGTPRRIRLWQIDHASLAWADMAAEVRGVVLPGRRALSEAPEPVGDGVPRRLWHLFWNADPTELSVRRHGRYIATRILGAHDVEADAWMIETLAPGDVLAACQTRGIPKERRKLAETIAGRL